MHRPALDVARGRHFLPPGAEADRHESVITAGIGAVLGLILGCIFAALIYSR